MKSNKKQSYEPTSMYMTVEQAAKQLQIGRTLAYRLADEYLATDGRSGLPVKRFGRLLPGSSLRSRGLGSRPRSAPHRRPTRRSTVITNPGQLTRLEGTRTASRLHGRAARPAVLRIGRREDQPDSGTVRLQI